MTENRRPFLLILFLGILNALTPFTIDLYLPAFGDIAQEFGTTAARVSLTLSGYFVGFALGQILYGPFLDRFGRKPPLYFGIGLYLLATLGCMNSHSLETLLLFRFLSAFGGAAASVAATAMVRDFFPAKEGAKVFSMLMLVLSASPLFAPTIGGWIAAAWGWRTIFAFLGGLAICDLLLVIFGLPVRYAADPTVSLRMGPIFRNFLEILSVRRFWTYTFAGSLSFAGLFVYLAGSPGIFIEGFHVSKQTYGAIFALLAMGMIGGGQMNTLFLKKWTSAQIFKTAISLQVLTGAIFLGAVLRGDLGLGPTIVFLFPLLVTAGISYPNAASLALEPFSKNIGSASSLLGFLQMGVGAVLAAMVGLLDVKGTLPTAIVMAISAFLARTVLWIGERTSERKTHRV